MGLNAHVAVDAAAPIARNTFPATPRNAPQSTKRRPLTGRLQSSAPPLSTRTTISTTHGFQRIGHNHKRYIRGFNFNSLLSRILGSKPRLTRSAELPRQQNATSTARTRVVDNRKRCNVTSPRAYTNACQLCPRASRSHPSRAGTTIVRIERCHIRGAHVGSKAADTPKYGPTYAHWCQLYKTVRSTRREYTVGLARRSILDAVKLRLETILNYTQITV